MLDSLHDVERLEQVAAERGATQDVLIRVTPNVSGDTHAAISTGQADSKFGFGLEDGPRAIDRIAASPHLRLVGLHCHIGSQLLDLEPFMRAVSALSTLGRLRRLQPRRRARGRVSGGPGAAVDRGLHVATLVNAAHARSVPASAC